MEKPAEEGCCLVQLAWKRVSLVWKSQTETLQEGFTEQLSCHQSPIKHTESWRMDDVVVQLEVRDV